MSFHIKHMIVHEILKNEGEKHSILTSSYAENQVNDDAVTLSRKLIKLFRKTGLNIGAFPIQVTADDPVPQFLSLLKKYHTNNNIKEFVTFTIAASKEFKLHLDAKQSSKGGYLWFNHYVYNDDHFLSIVLLRKKKELSLYDLTLDTVEELDLDKLHMAARINLTKWLSETSSQYIAFRVGKSAKGVTEYFSHFIGCKIIKWS